MSESSGTRKLKPIEEGKKPFFAALRSSVDSSASPADSGISPRSSSSSASPPCSGGEPAGIRKPVRYQFEGRTHPGSRSEARSWPAPGPIRSSLRASTRRSRTSREVVEAFWSLDGTSDMEKRLGDSSALYFRMVRPMWGSSVSLVVRLRPGYRISSEFRTIAWVIPAGMSYGHCTHEIAMRSGAPVPRMPSFVSTESRCRTIDAKMHMRNGRVGHARRHR